MVDKYTELLKRFDPIAIARYDITGRDLEIVERYIKLLQSDLSVNVWDEATDTGAEYGVSIIIHEVIQIRYLRGVGIMPLEYPREGLQRVLAQHIEAHTTALYEEHLYLQEVLMRKFEERYEVATLIKANYPDNNTDFNLLLESDVGIFLFESERVEQARRALERLKGR